MSISVLLRHLPWSTHRNRAGRAGRSRPHWRSAGHRPSFVPRLEVLEGRLTPAVLTVNTLADETAADNVLSLREAIAVVDSGSAAGLSSAELAQISGTLGQNDTIQFAPSLAGGTITLTAGRLAITQNLAIVGPGANQLTISGNAASRIFDISGTTTVSIRGLTLTKGLDTDFGGGAIFNESGATLNLSGCTLSGNEGVNFIGGALFNEFGATASVSKCTFTANRMIVLDNINNVYSACEGGAIDNDGTMTVVNSIFTGNQAIAGNTTHTDQATDANGGAIANDGTLTVSGSTFTGNQAICGNSNQISLADGGGIASFGALTVTDSTFTGNQAIAGNGATPDNVGSGGGIEATLFSTLTVMNCTFTGNLAMGGAGGSGARGGDGAGGGIDVRTDSTATIVNSTFNHNQAIGGPGGAGAAGGDGVGAGIAVGTGVLGGIFGISPDTSSLMLSGSTLTNNLALGGTGNMGGNGFGGGIYVAVDATVGLAGSTVTGNHANGGTGSGGSDGQGIGGGVYNLGAFSFDFATIIANNHASTSNNDTFGV